MPKDRTRSKPTGLPIIHPYAAGIEIGSRFHVVAVSPDLCDEPVQTFQAFTADLQRMADWLVATGTKTVVMESTGVYWVAAFEVLESRGLEVVLANAREARAVPGRKSDVNDASGCSGCTHAGCCERASDLAVTLPNCAPTCVPAKSTPTTPPRTSNTCRRR